MGVPLFIVEPTGRCRLSLRRFRHGAKSGAHYHDASVVIDEDAPVTPRGGGGHKHVRDSGRRVPHGDQRWPARCECGEPFTSTDEWQVNELDWYEGSGQRFAWGTGSWGGPPGAMIRAAWRDGTDPDNGLPAWIVFLPNGTMWCTRERSTVPGGDRIGPQWQVSGTPPCITVTPSINDQGPRPWHGWVRDGELVTA